MARYAIVSNIVVRSSLMVARNAMQSVRIQLYHVLRAVHQLSACTILSTLYALKTPARGVVHFNRFRPSTMAQQSRSAAHSCETSISPAGRPTRYIYIAQVSDSELSVNKCLHQATGLATWSFRTSSMTVWYREDGTYNVFRAS
jgi:hypothetical protein